MHELKHYLWDILGLAKVGWTGFIETTTDEGYKIWYYGEAPIWDRIHCVDKIL